jgi:hypothetical protein
MATPPLAYLMKQLGLTAKDWTGLSDRDKDDLKRWAAEEMAALGVDKA